VLAACLPRETVRGRLSGVECVDCVSCANLFDKDVGMACVADNLSDHAHIDEAQGGPSERSSWLQLGRRFERNRRHRLDSTTASR
jgi:hypothetical protein